MNISFDIFQISINDYSMQMLYYIFGPVMDVILETTEGAPPSMVADALAAGFSVFNAAVLFLGALYVIIHTVSAVMRTAHEGEVMGKSWSSMWVPLRLVIGFAILLPLGSGYSLIQNGVMWLSVMGAGVSNTVSTMMVDKMDPRRHMHINMQTEDVRPLATDVFISLSCAYDLQKAVASERAINKDLSKKELEAVAFSYQEANRGHHENPAFRNSTARYIFGDKSGTLGKDTCGSIEIDFGEQYEFITDTGVPNTDGSLSTGLIHDGYRSLASSQQQQLKAQLGRDFANAYKKNIEQMIVNIDKFVKERVNAGGDSDPYSPENSVALYKEAYAFNARMVDWVKARSSEEQLKGVWDLFVEDQQEKGWIMLGGLYYRLSVINDEFSAVTRLSAGSTIQTKSPAEMRSGSTWKFWDSAHNRARHLEEAKAKSVEEATLLISRWAEYLEENPGVLDEIKASVAGGVMREEPDFGTPTTARGVLDSMAEVMTPYLTATSFQVGDGENFITGARSPIVKAKEYGDNIVFFTTAGILALSQVKGSAAAADGGADAAGQSAAGLFGAGALKIVTGFFMGVLSVLAPIFMVLLAGFLFFGLTLAIYVPMIPFIVWIGGVVSWLTTIVEAMVIAPIWAMSFLSPEGEGFAGQRAEQGFLLVLSIFLRPVLMVFGFFAAMAASHVVFAFIDTVYFDVFTSTQSGFSMMLVWIGKWVIYSILALTTMTTIYRLIHIIPDRVLRWIGGGQEALGDMDAEAQSKAAFGAVIASSTSATSSTTAALMPKGKPEGGDGDKEKGKEAPAAADPQSAATGNAAAGDAAAGGNAAGGNANASGGNATQATEKSGGDAEPKNRTPN